MRKSVCQLVATVQSVNMSKWHVADAWFDAVNYSINWQMSAKGDAYGVKMTTTLSYSLSPSNYHNVKHFLHATDNLTCPLIASDFFPTPSRNVRLTADKYVISRYVKQRTVNKESVATIPATFWPLFTGSRLSEITTNLLIFPRSCLSFPKAFQLIKLGILKKYLRHSLNHFLKYFLSSW